MKKLFDRKDPHFSAPLLCVSLVNAAFQSPINEFLPFGTLGIVQIGLLILTLLCLLLSVFHPEKPIQIWNLVLTLGGLSLLTSMFFASY